jgi:membrane protein
LSTAAEERAGQSRAVGEVPAGPERLSPREWLAACKRAGKQFVADDCLGLAQQVAYSSLLAFFPAVVFLVGFLGLIHAYDDLQDFLNPVAPEAVTDIVRTLQEDTRTGGSVVAIVVGLCGAAWAASGAMGSVVKAVNRAHDRLETRPFWHVRLVSIVLVAAAGLVTAGTFLLIVLGGPVGEAIADRASLGGAFEALWNILRWPIAFVAVLLLFSLVYWLAPDQAQRHWRWITPGSVVGALLWLGLSGLFALYTSFSGSYSRTYGSLAGGIILLLWLNYTAWAILFGAELNSELDRQADIRASGGPRAGLVRRARRMR